MAVALVSIALLAAVTLLLADSDITNASRETEASSTSAIVATVRSTYRADPDWKPKDLTTAGDLAHAIGVGVVLRANGVVLLRVAAPSTGGPSRTLAVVVGNKTVAMATLTFPASGLLPEELAFRRSVEKSVVIASGLALLVAFGVALLASRRIVAPVRKLIQATRRLGAGDPSSRVGELRAPGELAELGLALDTMAAKLERENALRRALVADLAHELRAPLAVLQAELEALSVGLVAFDERTVVSFTEEVGRLSRLVEDLRVLAAADAAGLSLRKQRVDLAQVASSAAARLAPRFIERDVDLTTSLSGAMLEGDPDRLEQVVVNLLSNAAKFTDPGGTVRLSVESNAHNGYITVTDTGKGIPTEEQALVFDRFFRGAGTGSTPGSGIGLAVVAALVAAHGGSVSLQSSLGSGSTFIVRLPSD